METIIVNSSFASLQSAYQMGHQWYATPTSEAADRISQIYCDSQKHFKHDFLAILWEEWEEVLGFDLSTTEEVTEDEDFEVSLEVPRERSALRATRRAGL